VKATAEERVRATDTITKADLSIPKIELLVNSIAMLGKTALPSKWPQDAGGTRETQISRVIAEQRKNAGSRDQQQLQLPQLNQYAPKVPKKRALQNVQIQPLLGAITIATANLPTVHLHIVHANKNKRAQLQQLQEQLMRADLKPCKNLDQIFHQLPQPTGLINHII